MDLGDVLLAGYLLDRNVPFNSRHARAFPVCRGLVWILFDWRITDLKTRVAILENGETALNESVKGLYRSEATF